MTARNSRNTEKARVEGARAEEWLPAAPERAGAMPKGRGAAAGRKRGEWAEAASREGAASLKTLLDVMARLRDPEKGCPWDRKQTLASLKPCLIEESYETLDALEDGNPAHLEEELGDLLFQIVFLSRIASEDGLFGFAQVARGIAEKLVRRHPHVFGTVEVDGPDAVVRNWEEIKKGEPDKAGRKSVLDSIERHAPPLHRAYQLQKKAAKVGFDWSRLDEVFAKLDEEVGEFKEAVMGGKRDEIIAELGDILFTVVNAARFVECDPAYALDCTNRKFERRFRVVESELASQGKRMEDCSLPEMEAIWDRQRREEHEAAAAAEAEIAAKKGKNAEKPPKNAQNGAKTAKKPKKTTKNRTK